MVTDVAVGDCVEITGAKLPAHYNECQVNSHTTNYLRLTVVTADTAAADTSGNLSEKRETT